MRSSFFLPLSFALPAVALCIVFSSPSSATAQAYGTAQNTRVATPRLELSLGYNHIQANAPPGGCKCFGINGGYASADVHLTNWLAVEGLVTGGHANDISLLGQDLNLLTYSGGLKAAYPGHRLVPFIDATGGRAHGYDSYFPSSNNAGYTTAASSLTYTAGGGVEYSFRDHLAVRGFAEFLQTQFPNGTNDDTQNHLMAGVGIVLKLGMVGAPHRHFAAAPPQPETEDMQLSCSSSVTNVDQGDTLEILANTLTQPGKLQVSLEWTTSVGKVVGTGRRVLLDTVGIPPGEYHVLGHASVAGRPHLTADCDIPFRIKTPTETLKAPTPAPRVDPPDPNRDREFHANVRDLLFDFDRANIRPDAQLAITQAAGYINAHAGVDVLIGGFADDRGSAEYNLNLGQRRAEAARNALIAAGVDPARLQIISYGKQVQVCTTEDDTCRQQNRRAAFSLRP